MDGRQLDYDTSKNDMTYVNMKHNTVGKVANKSKVNGGIRLVSVRSLHHEYTRGYSMKVYLSLLF